MAQLEAVPKGSWVVCKFGGTSVTSPESLRHLESIVEAHHQFGAKVLLVASALSGVSNRLESFCNQPSEQNRTALLSDFLDAHQAWLDRLNLKRTASELLKSQLESLSELTERFPDAQGQERLMCRARIMALGELSSTQLICHLLKDNGRVVTLIDSRDYLVAQSTKDQALDDQFLNAYCEVHFSAEKVSQLERFESIVVAQGFIASNEAHQTVLLGRGGSDTSAAYFAALIGAYRLEIWTDVPGMFSANPRALPQARQLLKLDYREAQEIASTGGKVLHPRCLRPARQAGIPVFVGSSFAPDQGGTFIGTWPQSEPQVKAVSVREGVSLVVMETADMWQKPGFLAEAFGKFAELGLSIDQVSTSETNVTVSLDNLTQDVSDERLSTLSVALQDICRVSIIRESAAISIVGREIRTMLPKLSSAFSVFQNRSVHMLTQAANNLNFTFVVENSEAIQLVQHIHQSLISQTRMSEYFGPTWDELTGQTTQRAQALVTGRWWYSRTDELQKVVETGPCYVYSRAKVQSQLEKLLGLAAIDRVFYAMKANSHPDILKIVYEYGLGLECVSINEVERVLNLFPNIERKRVLFTPNFAPREEYKRAIELGVQLTFDNLFPILEWGEDFSGAKVLLRVDTGAGSGHHEHVKTAGVEAKFGIPIVDIRQHLNDFVKKRIKIIGLHCHVGSGILDSANWYNNGAVLAELLQDLPDVEVLDLGGGLGIVEKPDQSELELGEVNQTLMRLKQRLGNVQLWLEPGRFIVAESGVLVAKVTQLKVKGNAGYLGIETGMNALIRPALYGAYHPIYNLSKLDQTASHHYTIVGPICETGDKLGVDRLMPESFEGDTILIDNVGAYGRVMASSYNLRQPPEEKIID